MQQLTTRSGDHVITYHEGCENSDDCYGVGWQFDLAHEDSGVRHYSLSYPTAGEALDAAENWEAGLDPDGVHLR